MTKYQAIRRMIEKECQRISLTDLCEHWDVTCEDFYEFLDAARPNEEMDDREEIKELEQSQGGWVSIDDRLPEPTVNVVVLLDTGHPRIGYIGQGSKVWWSGGYAIVPDVTHWMPLPEPPKGVEGE